MPDPINISRKNATDRELLDALSSVVLGYEDPTSHLHVPGILEQLQAVIKENTFNKKINDYIIKSMGAIIMLNFFGVEHASKIFDVFKTIFGGH